MKPVAITKAQEHIELAKAAVEQLTLEGGFTPLQQAWSHFLSQASRFYSKIEQGSKGCGKSEAWFGAKKHERRKDPLLSYVHQARNAEEHSLEYVTAVTGDSGHAYMKEGAEKVHVSFDFMRDSLGRTHVRNLETKTPDAIDRLELANPRVDLIAVRDGRSGKSFDPPETHLGRPIVGNGPEAVARLGIKYLEEMLREASELPTHE